MKRTFCLSNKFIYNKKYLHGYLQVNFLIINVLLFFVNVNGLNATLLYYLHPILAIFTTFTFTIIIYYLFTIVVK